MNKAQKNNPNNHNTTAEFVDVISTLTYCVDVLDHIQKLYTTTKSLLHTSYEPSRT